MNESLLYISYDGMLEPLGQSQVLAYLERLAVTRTIHLLSFEKASDWRDVPARERMRTRMRNAGIHWHPRRYHKRPSALATTFDLLVGSASGIWLVHRHRLNIVHARSYVAAAMALMIKRLSRARFVFDMRGFWADERVDGGLWRRDSRMYRVSKKFEKRFLLRADSVVSLTQAAVREMQRFPYLRESMPAITVIPTCADLERFAPTPLPGGEFVLGYVGSAGTWYLFDEAVAAFRRLRTLRPRARWLIVNRGEHAHILSRLAAGRVPLDAVELRAADHSQIHALMARMHAAVFFIKPVFSKQASAPTKLAELLGCGVPCLANHGVGDMAELLEHEHVGVAVNAFAPEALDAGLRQLLELARAPDIRERCAQAARAHFSLEEGVSRYAAIYRSLGARA